MALIFFDGFDTYGTPATPAASSIAGVAGSVPLLAANWLGTSPASPTTLNIIKFGSSIDPDGRNWFGFGTATTSASGFNQTGAKYKVFDVGSSTGMVFGFKAIISSVSASSSIGRFMAGAYCVDLYATYATSGDITISAGQTQSASTSTWWSIGATTTSVGTAVTVGTTPSLIIGASVGSAAINTIEVQIDRNSGVLSVWINNAFVGTVTISATNAGLAGNTTFGACFASARTTATTSTQPLHNITDFYALTTDGATPTSRLGKVKVVTRVPTADVSTAFTRPSGASSNASVVAQIPPSATNYLTGVNDGDTDMYSSTAFNFSNETIVATALVTSAFKTDPTGNDIAPVLKLTSEHEGSVVTLPAGTSYTTGMTIFTTNPETGLRFTKAQLDASTFGVRVKDTTP